MTDRVFNVGIQHPGEMGAAIAASAVNTGMKVYWCSQQRSEATHERAKASGLDAVSTLQELCDTCDILVSVCPPHAAIDQAEKVIACGYQGIYADVNAIAPATVALIAEKMAAAGIICVDGGIIGLPPTQRNTTWLYLSGKEARQARSARIRSAGTARSRGGSAAAAGVGNVGGEEFGL